MEEKILGWVLINGIIELLKLELFFHFFFGLKEMKYNMLELRRFKKEKRIQFYDKNKAYTSSKIKYKTI